MSYNNNSVIGEIGQETTLKEILLQLPRNLQYIKLKYDDRSKRPPYLHVVKDIFDVIEIDLLICENIYRGKPLPDEKGIDYLKRFKSSRVSYDYRNAPIRLLNAVHENPFFADLILEVTAPVSIIYTCVIAVRMLIRTIGEKRFNESLDVTIRTINEKMKETTNISEVTALGELAEKVITTAREHYAMKEKLQITPFKK